MLTCRLVVSRSLRNESADPTLQKERICGIGSVNPWIWLYESAESDLLIPRHHDSDSESLIRYIILDVDSFSSGMNDISFGIMDADKFLRVEQEMLRFG
ncbi:hypothetical protein AVEN_251604-1 [Araneus ventricosus]|uniref:Uncharacterized protein n=1 Tax=Araneus ventricosus TaxID=182803 RepID=A0A4Y2PEV9_ARAVE|nr:hypothetical protein AVEN_251604-1 [Araneus ventricosus]